MTRIAYAGITVQDRIYFLNNLPDGGRKYQSNQYLETGGGPVATVAVAIVRLSIDVNFIGRVGDDSCGNILLNELQSWGVNTAFCRQYPSPRSFQSAILVDQHGERIIVNYPSPDFGTDARWLESIDFSRYDIVLADVHWHEGTLKPFELARAAGVPTLLDADMTPQDITSLVAPADRAVFSTLGLKRMTGQDDAQQALELATKQINGKVYVTLDGEGSLWIENGHMCQQTAFSVNVVNTTGAGDIFHGTMAAALAEQMPTDQAIRLTSAVAAMKCAQAGGRTGIPNRTQTESFLSLCAQNSRQLRGGSPGVLTSITEVTGNPRHDQLVHYIIGRGYMNIEELAQLLDVSTQTVRRDIRKLSGQGLITRHHGGAGRVSSVMNTAFEQRELSLTQEKEAITEAVTDYLPERCTVFITIGTTVEVVVRALLNRRDLHIITNSLRVAQILYKNQDLEVMVPDGMLRAHNGGTVGPGAVNFIERFRADYLITSIDAIEEDDTLLEFDANEALVAKTVIEHARNTLLVANYTEFTASAAVSIGNIRKIRAFFTDSQPPNSLKQLLDLENIELAVAEQETT